MFDSHAFAAATVPSCTVSVVDFSRLMPLLSDPGGPVATTVLERLDEKLAAATLVQPHEIEHGLVTMNSKVLLASAAWSGAREYRLVYSHQKLCGANELSIFSELGAGLFGSKIGERVALSPGVGGRVIELLALSYQPENAGDWDL